MNQVAKNIVSFEQYMFNFFETNKVVCVSTSFDK